MDIRGAAKTLRRTTRHEMKRPPARQRVSQGVSVCRYPGAGQGSRPSGCASYQDRQLAHRERSDAQELGLHSAKASHDVLNGTSSFWGDGVLCPIPAQQSQDASVTPRLAASRLEARATGHTPDDLTGLQERFRDEDA